MALISGIRAKALALTLVIPAVLIAGGCKSGTSTYSGPAAAVSASEDSGIDTNQAPLVAADNQPVDSTCPTTNTITFAKTKFVAHTGLAFGAARQWLYKPVKAGTFKAGAKGRTMAIVKAGVAAVFVVREVRLASQDVKANPTLCKVLAKPLAQVGNAVQGAVAKLRGGDTSGVNSLESQISAIESQAKNAGDTITENANANIYSVPN